MTPDFISSLVNLGSAGAVIIVVIIFLRSNEKRDGEWRDFFTALNSTNKADICKLAELMQSMIQELSAHDHYAHEMRAVIDTVARDLRRKRSAGDEPKTSDRQYIPPKE